jgi:hypothetical protein
MQITRNSLDTATGPSHSSCVPTLCCVIASPSYVGGVLTLFRHRYGPERNAMRACHRGRANAYSRPRGRRGGLPRTRRPVPGGPTAALLRPRGRPSTIAPCPIRWKSHSRMRSSEARAACRSRTAAQNSGVGGRAGAAAVPRPQPERQRGLASTTPVVPDLPKSPPNPIRPDED